MTDTAISVQGLGKNYIIGHKKEGDFRHAIGNKLKNIFKPDASEKEVFWALKDINFEIKHGEAVGIIGRNGAGKSTLLKILSRITDPSTGRFEINGRVSSLLEVGTGFHPELSGRENIYLNGTILGMKRAEIRQKFDEIVDFSGVEKFLDTPVKHYSSGMKVRLAFSVAAHLEPEILIVDEVLAVGDAEFQKKCLGKMDQVSKNEGRTVLFVSHNMVAVESLCPNSILLEQSQIQAFEKTPTVISKYLTKNTYDKNFLEHSYLNEFCEVVEFSISKMVINIFEGFRYKLSLKSRDVNQITDLALLFYNEYQERVAIIDLRNGKLQEISKKSNTVIIEGEITLNGLLEGKYQLGIYIASNYCTGNFLSLLTLNVRGNNSDVIPYPKNVRGYLNFKNEHRTYEK